MAITPGPNPPPLAGGPLVAGPMVGQVGPTDAYIWAQARRTGTTTCVVENTSIVVTTTAYDDDSNGVVKFHLAGLTPNTRYNFVIGGASNADGLAAGSFATAPADSARRCKIAFGSCFAQWKIANAPIFDAIASDTPNLFVFAGDSIYSDDADRTSQRTMMLAHMRCKNHDSIRGMLLQIPTVATWDDHDYGPNNADGSYGGEPTDARKVNALNAWVQSWANLTYGDGVHTGVFSRVRCGPAELFLLDDRYNRVAPGKPGGPVILGAHQLSWLKAALSSSTARIKLIVSGSVVLPEFVHQPNTPGYEGWRYDAPGERGDLLAHIEANNITGVVFISGDLHQGYLYRRLGTPKSGGRRGPDYFELISSPLGNDIWKDPIVDAPLGETFYDAGIYQEVRDLNYGMVDIDLDRAGSEVQLSLRDKDGTPFFTHGIGLNVLATRTPLEPLRAVTWVGGKAYFFKGDQYVRYTVGNVGSVQHIDSGYPAPIHGNWRDFDQVDAGFVTGDKAYLFNGNGYLRMSPPAGNPTAVAGLWTEDSGYPGYIARAWTGFFKFELDAAVVWPTNNKLYVFRGTQYVRCAADTHVAETAPLPIRGNWPGLAEAFPDGVDAAVVWSATTAYFFKGDQYVRYNIGPTGEGVMAGYPKPIAGAWPDLAAL